MDKVFFTSDLHAFHDNIIRFDNRPFSSVEEMNQIQREKWNAKVSKSDHIYCIGDMSWRCDDNAVEYMKSLNGFKHLILGNHDRVKANKMKNVYESIEKYDEINVKLESGESKKVILSHYFIPLYNSHYYGAIMLHGHTHNSKEHDLELEIIDFLNRNECPCESYNIGNMHWNYEPVTLDEIISLKLDQTSKYENNKHFNIKSNMPIIKAECVNDFIKEFNANKPSDEFFNTCKTAGELIDIKGAKK